MIKLIVGHKGSGKTKALIQMATDAVETSKGNVVCVEKGDTLKFDLTHRVRLIDIDDYSISGFDACYGFYAGLFAGNYDITEVFVDGIFKVGGKDFVAFGVFIEKLAKLLETNVATMTLTVSCEKEDRSAGIHKYII